MAELGDEVDVREQVRERYAAAARDVASTQRSGGCGCAPADSSCCGPALVSLGGGPAVQVFGGGLYGAEQGSAAEAAPASMGCGVPTAMADLHAGETVLDLGSGAGVDVMICAREVGPTGHVYGLDMTDEMLEVARENAARAGIDNVEFLKGYLEEIPLPDASVDVVVSNCTINLAVDKRTVLAETARVLRPGGRLAVSDVIADPGTDAARSADIAAWTGCIAGALTREQFEAGLADAGFVDVEIVETHRVHEHAASAIVRARRATA